MAYLRILPGGHNVPLSDNRAELGHFGWETQFLPIALREGHEIITREAIPADRTIRFAVNGVAKSWPLSAPDVQTIIRGNQDTDIQYLRRARRLALPALISRTARFMSAANVLRYAAATFAPDEQKHHALRRTRDQPQPEALRDIVEDLRRQHSSILAEADWNRKLWRIGQAIHLVQDAFSPAHMEREPASRGCILRIRNYGAGSALFRPGAGGPEHVVPTDARDRVSNHPAFKQAAVLATQQYLGIVFKALYGRDRRNPDAAQATGEAGEELNRFITDHFRLC